MGIAMINQKDKKLYNLIHFHTINDIEIIRKPLYN